MAIQTVKAFREYTEEEYYTLLEKHENMYAIPCDKVPSLYVKLQPYFNKAEKLNIPYSVIERGTVTLKDTPCLIFTMAFLIKNEDWKFIAVIDHMDNGNIVKVFGGMTIPEKYRHAQNTVCDHCGTVRNRKQTFILYNEQTKEYKQVGRQCLKVYTGINVEEVMACMDILSQIDTYASGSGEEYDPDMYEAYMNMRTNYYELLEVLSIAWDTVKVFGYAKAGSKNSTKERVMDFYDYLKGDTFKYNRKEHKRISAILEENNIQLLSDDSINKAKEIKEFILSQKVTSDYMNNLHVLFEHDFVDRKYFSFVVSAIAVYNREQEKQQAWQDKHAQDKASSYIGNIGDKITVNVKDYSLLTSWDDTFNGGYTYTTTYLYKFTDAEQNIFTWKTQKIIADGTEVRTLTGTIKDHADYKGIKQTVLTRCKIM